eukprot:TRINITY_DN3054_c0_g7_i1.p1 TRINITY_DN3054_c0_g7~~TRINITY_DN3054_c0_g7_i1.p1  ORF type:complete len:305 (+),score=34.99 TRINITY_DN3054_c0_g7_i1:448-1362(+)
MSVLHYGVIESQSLSLLSFGVGRLLLGFSVGLYSSVIPIYSMLHEYCVVNEIAPKHLTGMFGACHQLFLSLATMLTALVGMSLTVEEDHERQRESWSWRLAYAGPLLFSSLQMLLLALVYKFESPLFYAGRQSLEMARKVLANIYPEPSDVDAAMGELAEHTKSKSSQVTVSLYSMYKYALWMGIAIPAIQQLSGVNVVMYYAPTVFENQGDNKLTLTFITFFLNFASTLISVFVSDKLGRRLLLIYGSLGCAAGLLFSTVGYTDPAAGESSAAMNWVFNGGVFFFISAFGVSHGPVWYFVCTG